MDKKLKVAIIGCGNISHSHTQAYQKNPNVEIVACCDINEQRAKDYANIRSYIETCRLYGVNEYESLTRLVEDNPYTFKELQSLKNK